MYSCIHTTWKNSLFFYMFHISKSFFLSWNAAFMEMDLPPTGKSQRMPRQKRSAPPTIYPEILVIVDYDGYR